MTEVVGQTTWDGAATLDLPIDVVTGCVWPIVPCPEAEEGSPSDEVVGMAVDFLRAWTGNVFGLCPATVRPCRGDCGQRPPTFWGKGPYPGPSGGWVPVVIGGEWHNIGCGTCSGTCLCEAPCSIALPGPVHEVTEVRIDGEVVDPATYRVDHRRHLVRTGGDGCWPTCQDFTADPATDPDTFEVSYLRGVAVPYGGQVAAGLLACEMAKALAGNPDCVLPRRIQNITRQGVTVTLMDNFEEMEKGRTGIWLVDSWVTSVTKPQTRRSMVMSPDYRSRP